MAIDMFLKIDGIPGESTDARHPDEIDILSYTWGESHPAAASSGGGGGSSAGRVTMQDFHFAMHLNKASPKLFLACASGAHIRNAILTMRRSGENPIEFLKWTFTDVTIASYQTGAIVPPGELLTDQVSLRFAKIATEYTPMNANGTPGVPIKAGWDLTANRPI
jgi:type VI secretion system secreted protein Hcp